jgi:hypothetical protein
MNGHLSQEDLALYSMQALEPAEQRAAESHLRECATCRADLAQYYADLALVGLSVEQHPMPQGASQRLIALIANTPQVGAEAKAAASAAGAKADARDKRSAGASGLFGWIGWAVAAAAVVFAMVMHNHNREAQNQIEQAQNQNAQTQSQIDADRGEIARLSAERARAQQLMQALTSPAAQQVTLTETKQPTQPVGHAAYLRQRGALVFVASNLHPLAPGKTYELWLIPADGKAPIPAGLFRPDAAGAASVVLPPLPEGVAAKAFGVTIENSGGASAPTMPIVMSGG